MQFKAFLLVFANHDHRLIDVQKCANGSTYAIIIHALARFSKPDWILHKFGSFGLFAQIMMC